MEDLPEIAPATRNIREQIASPIEDAINLVVPAGSEGVTWDLGYIPFTSPAGETEIHAALILSLQSPILGRPPLMVSIVRDPHTMRDAEEAERVVRQGIEMLRDARSQVLAQANGG